MDGSKTILFIDPTTPKPYGPGIPTGVGGTEITVLAIARGLRDKGYSVIVEQHNRTKNEEEAGISYTTPRLSTKADYVICLRDPSSLLDARERFPNTPLYLWAHDLYDQNSALATMAAIKATNPKFILCVSEFHTAQVKNSMVNLPSAGDTKIRVTYPPIPNDLQPDDTIIDYSKLCYISSPHKGLDYALDLFKYLRRKEGSLSLHVTNPGYLEGKPINQAGVKVRGSLEHAEVISLLRSSLCLFFPNTVFPETFGRVYAEAEAVGTPVLTHSLGAAAEVISDARELVDCNNQQEVIDRVLEWHKGRRPTVRAKKSFRLSRVINHWVKELLK